MPKLITENALSAVNQQGRSRKRNPQRLYVEYPTSSKNEMSDIEATLLGILYTDGCLSKRSKNAWRFYLSNTSYIIIQVFKNCMINLFKLDAKRVRISKKQVNGKPFYRAVVDSASSGEFLNSKYGTFRTLVFKSEDGKEIYPSTKLPFNKNSNLKIMSKFLKVAFSCDGGINLYVAKSKFGYKFLIRNVYLACKHPQLQIDYHELLKVLGIESKIIKGDGKILIQGRNELNKFREKVGFIEGVKITQNSKFWQGVEKRNVLNIAIGSYKNPKKIINLSRFRG
ncbi:MAG: LAGLIDADG family homing endonuclease [bacterium]|nr:MAG: LAGLIDADG family homing endonuclease [bacterium]